MASSELENAEAIKVIKIPFKLFPFEDKSSGKKYLKLAQPDDDTSERKRKKGRLNYPSVSIKKEDTVNTFAFHIMQQVNHENILSLKSMMEPNTDEEGSVSAIVEEHIKLSEGEVMENLSDDLGNIPSESFRRIVREIVCAIDFLREMGLYHGNLSWDALYRTIVDPGGSSTLKLGDFKKKSEKLTLEEAQWNDVDSLIDMLECASNHASSRNNEAKGKKLYLGDLDALIQNLKDLKNSCLLEEVKHKVLANVFFWDARNRSELYVCTLPKLLEQKSEDEAFMKDISSLTICEFPWYKDDSDSADQGQVVLSPVCQQFKALVDQMNMHQIKLGSKHFDRYSPLDFLELLSAAYTHRHEMGIDVDRAIRGQFPKAVVELKRLTDKYFHKEITNSDMRVH